MTNHDNYTTCNGPFLTLASLFRNNLRIVLKDLVFQAILAIFSALNLLKGMQVNMIPTPVFTHSALLSFCQPFIALQNRELVQERPAGRFLSNIDPDLQLCCRHQNEQDSHRAWWTSMGKRQSRA